MPRALFMWQALLIPLNSDLQNGACFKTEPKFAHNTKFSE